MNGLIKLNIIEPVNHAKTALIRAKYEIGTYSPYPSVEIVSKIYQIVLPILAKFLLVNSSKGRSKTLQTTAAKKIAEAPTVIIDLHGYANNMHLHEKSKLGLILYFAIYILAISF